MKNVKSLTATAIMIFTVACGHRNEAFDQKPDSYLEKEKTEMENKPALDSIASSFISSTAAKVNGKDSLHKFIRAADIRFRVKNVVNSTYSIEDIVVREGGFVTFTELSSQVDNVSTVAVDPDTSLETTHYTVVNTMSLRVPNTRLDTTLKQIAKLVDFMDHRTIKADDVGFKLMLDELNQKRWRKNEQRIITDIDKRGKKLDESINGEENVLGKQQFIDETKVNDLSLMEQVNFSTITLAIYQRPSVKKERVASEKSIDAYEPGLGSRMLTAFNSGWKVLKMMLVGLVQLWWFILFCSAGWIVCRKYFLRTKPKMNA
ncbi:MAG TPA: DUF4349 domain-containing protein [Bacteroidia bacterium]|jgi:hypothetical protein